MRDTLIRSVFTVIYGLVHCSWKQRLNASRVGYKMGFWRNCCHMIMKNENWEWRVSLKFAFPFLFLIFTLLSVISVKLRNRAVTRTDITMTGVNRSYLTFHAPSLLRIPHAIHWPPLQCCRRAGERGMSTALTKRGRVRRSYFDMKIIFYSHVNKTHFPKKDFALASF